MIGSDMTHTLTTALSSPRKLVLFLFVIAFTLLAPLSSAARASSSEEEKEPYDARLENYGNNMTLEQTGTALTWFVFGFMAIMVIGVMFKNANRSHLD
jgi:cytochrome oxidase assembly protein ShyY1